jgi:hypothetical protein
MNRRGVFPVVCLISAAVIAGVLAVAGCGPRVGTGSSEPIAAAPPGDPWETVSRQLRKDTELPSCKAALGQLNNELAERPGAAGPAPLTGDAIKSLAALVPLSPDDLAEIRPAAYSRLDPAYIADCFYLQDAARSLDPSGLAPAERARIGFAWVCRQLYLDPWFIQGQQIPAIPPTYSLRRGSGTGLDRAYVFLALLQQMGLDGCLIGEPGASEKMTFKTSPANDGVNKGPFFAVGVRIGADILLFEPWRGEPFPGPGGTGIGTLAQVKADPNQLKNWFEDRAKPWDVNAAAIKQASVVLAVPLNSLSPRIALLERKLKAETGVNLAIDPAALRARFAASSPDGPAVTETKFWNPLGDRFTYCRSLIAFLPLEEGGLDRAPPGERLFSLYWHSMLPLSLLDLPRELKSQAAIERLQTSILAVYGASFFSPPTPRERIQRGRFQDAARDLMEKLQNFGRGQERLRSLDAAAVTAWCEAANTLYENLNLKRFPTIGQIAPQPDTDPEVIAARNAIEEFWRRGEVGHLLIDRATAALGRSEAAFLLALAKHEEAERLQLRADRLGGAANSAANAWLEAANAWDSFLQQNSSTDLPRRAEHARLLAARARHYASGK